MLLSIIIVNYKTTDLVLDCLESVVSQPHFDANTEIFVVDNDSCDNVAEKLAFKFPAVKFIQMGYNAGFARANNAAIREAKGDAVLLLNSDTIVIGDVIQGCFRDLMKSEYIAAGVQLLNADKTPQISGNFAMTGGLNYLLPLPYIGGILGSLSKGVGVKKPNIPNTTSTTEVDWINGAFLMVKREAFGQAGLMDEDFFLYAEEAEWCGRLRKQGRLCIFGQYNVIHLQGESAGAAFDSKAKGYSNIFDKKGRQVLLSNMVRIRKQFGLGWFIFHLLMQLITIPVFFIGFFVEKLLKGQKSVYSFADVKGYVANWLYIVSRSLKIISNKPYFYKAL